MALEPSHAVLQPGPAGWPLGADQALLQGLLAADDSRTVRIRMHKLQLLLLFISFSA